MTDKITIYWPAAVQGLMISLIFKEIQGLKHYKQEEEEKFS